MHIVDHISLDSSQDEKLLGQ